MKHFQSIEKINTGIALHDNPIMQRLWVFVQYGKASA